MSLPNHIPDLLAKLMELAPAGFAVGLHVRYLAPTYMFQTYPVEWLEEYSHQGFAMQDPTIAWALGNRGVIAWDYLRDRDAAGVFDRAREHGLVHGFSVSYESEGSLSAGSFVRGDRAFSPEEMDAVQGVLAELHRVTAPAPPLPDGTRDALRRLSVAFTQP